MNLLGTGHLQINTHARITGVSIMVLMGAYDYVSEREPRCRPSRATRTGDGRRLWRRLFYCRRTQDHRVCRTPSAFAVQFMLRRPLVRSIQRPLALPQVVEKASAQIHVPFNQPTPLYPVGQPPMNWPLGTPFVLKLAYPKQTGSKPIPFHPLTGPSRRKKLHRTANHALALYR